MLMAISPNRTDALKELRTISGMVFSIRFLQKRLYASTQSYITSASNRIIVIKWQMIHVWWILHRTLIGPWKTIRVVPDGYETR